MASSHCVDSHMSANVPTSAHRREGSARCLKPEIIEIILKIEVIS
jgi:hypothetical protein